MNWLRNLLKVAFRLLYNEMAWTYDVVSWVVSMGQWRSWQRAGFARLRGQRVLEIAHGTGNMLLDLSALGLQPTGLDLSAAMGRIASRKLKRNGVAVPLVRARVQNLPFANQSFPSLFATFPTEFIVDPPALAEFYRVLQAGGVLVAVPVAQVTGLSLPDRFADWLFRVTGQSATNWFAPLIERYAQAGFTAHIERVTLPRSIVTLIVAEKPWLRPDIS